MKVKLSADAKHSISSLREHIKASLSEFDDVMTKLEATEARLSEFREARDGEPNPARQMQLEATIELTRREADVVREEAETSRKAVLRAVQRAANVLRVALQETFEASRQSAAESIAPYFENQTRALNVVDSSDFVRVWRNQLTGYWAASGGPEIARQLILWLDAFLEGNDAWFKPSTN